MKKQMKNVPILLTIVAIIVLLSGACRKNCRDDDRLTKQELSITEKIKGVIVEGPWDVSITQDSINNSAMLEYSTSEKNRIIAELRPNGYLHIKILYQSKWNSDCKTFRAKINATMLENIDASGAAIIRTYGYFRALSDISLSGASEINGLESEGRYAKLNLSGASKLKKFTFTGNSIDAKLSGASHISLDNTNIDDCKVNCSGASTFDGRGYAAKTTFSGSGASDFKTFDLESENLDIDLSGASSADVTVNHTIKGRLTGASILRYKKAKNVNVSLEGASKTIPL